MVVLSHTCQPAPLTPTMGRFAENIPEIPAELPFSNLSGQNCILGLLILANTPPIIPAMLPPFHRRSATLPSDTTPPSLTSQLTQSPVIRSLPRPLLLHCGGPLATPLVFASQPKTTPF